MNAKVRDFEEEMLGLGVDLAGSHDQKANLLKPEKNDEDDELPPENFCESEEVSITSIAEYIRIYNQG